MAAPQKLPQESDLTEEELWDLFVRADGAGFKVEMIEGQPVLEAWPGVRHQAVVAQVMGDLLARTGGGSGCGSHPHYDIYVRFPDGSFKRPDISIFCKEIEQVDGATHAVPDAVIEIISRGYVKKDLEVGPPFYLKHGVKDVVAVNPYKATLRHITRLKSTEYPLPVQLTLSIGCTVEIKP